MVPRLQCIQRTCFLLKLHGLLISRTWDPLCLKEHRWKTLRPLTKRHDVRNWTYHVLYCRKLSNSWRSQNSQSFAALYGWSRIHPLQIISSWWILQGKGSKEETWRWRC
jgi:hypothetical protein